MAESSSEPAAADEPPARRQGPRRREGTAVGTERRNGDRRSTPGIVALLRALFGRERV